MNALLQWKNNKNWPIYFRGKVIILHSKFYLGREIIVPKTLLYENNIKCFIDIISLKFQFSCIKTLQKMQLNFSKNTKNFKCFSCYFLKNWTI